MPGETRLSVAIIARDAEQAIQETLTSIRGIADEIVVVDTGSADATARVAASAGAKVLHRPWDDDFSVARNFALDNAAGDWVLWLDAGETMSREAAGGLRQWLDGQRAAGRVVALLVAVPPAPQAISGEQVARIRLHPRRPDLRFKGRVRESLLDAVEAAGLPIEHAPWSIVRGERDNQPEAKLAKARRDLRLVNLEIQDCGQRPDLLVALGESLSQLGDESGAASAFRLALDGARAGSRTMRAACYGLLSCQAEDASSRRRLIGICSDGLKLFPLDAQLLCALGGYLQAEDRLDLAQQAYRTAYEHGEVDPMLWHIPQIDLIAGVCLALVQQLQDRDDEARQTLGGLLERYPDSVRVRRHLIDLHIKRNERREALEEFDRLPADIPHREAFRSAIRGACLAARKNWIPAIAYLQTAYQAGCRDPLCLRWLAVGLLSDGQLDVAKPVLEEWHAADPRNVEARKYIEAMAAGSLEAEISRNAKPSGQFYRVDVPSAPPGPAGVSPSHTSQPLPRG